MQPQVDTQNKVDPILPQEKVDVKVQETAEPVQETEKDINWKKFKEARAIERKQAEEVAKRAAEKEQEAAALKAALEAVLNKPSQQQQQEYIEESDDNRIERKVAELLAKREAEMEAIRQQQEQATMPQRLKNMHSDFDQVCTTTNLDYLEYHHPELARSLGAMPQSVEKWNDIYSAIKRYVPNTDSRKEQAKVEANNKKPQSLSSATVTPTGNSTPDGKAQEARRAENWARMQKLIKSV